jgi:carboxylesterase
VIHAHEDHVVPAANAMEVVKTIKSDDIRLLWLTNSYHVATLDNDKDLIVERVGRFFAEFVDGDSRQPRRDLAREHAAR